MIDEHNEIESKLDAKQVLVRDFKTFMTGQEQRGELVIEKYEHVLGNDVYYEQGDNVIRHRYDDNYGWQELTVKRRKTSSSTRDRLEIDLRFADKTKYDSVQAFLVATGFKPVFKLIKDAHIFWVRLTPSLTATFVLYESWQPDLAKMAGHPRRRFIEIEMEKGSDITVETAKRHLSTWVKAVQWHFGLDGVMNESLYEIYSGKRYQTVA